MVVPPAFPTWIKYIRGLDGTTKFEVFWLRTTIVEDGGELLTIILYEEDGDGGWA
jgi:hypothetical protein